MTTQTIDAIRNNLDDDNTLSRPNIEYLLSEIDSLRSRLARVQAGEVGALAKIASQYMNFDRETTVVVKLGDIRDALTAAQPQAAPADGAAKGDAK